MTYTKEFEEWARRYKHFENPQYVVCGHWHDALSAFVRLVREEANVQPHEPFQLKHTAEAFNSICSRFCLEDK